MRMRMRMHAVGSTGLALHLAPGTWQLRQQEQGKALRQQALQLWAAPNIDAAALDAVRKQQSVLHDRTTSRMQQAMVDAGRLLSPEQRAKLAERMKKGMQRMQQRRGS